MIILTFIEKRVVDCQWLLMELSSLGFTT